MSFWSALAWCNWRSERQGLAPCYQLEGCRGLPGAGLVCDAVVSTYESVEACPGFRLPTEDEWEVAARGGTSMAFPCGDIAVAAAGCVEEDPLAGDVGWHCGNSGGRTHRVGSKGANAYGLFDMNGNVWEWTWDVYGAGDLRVVRGGGYSFPARFSRSAARAAARADTRDSAIGFRPVRSASGNERVQSLPLPEATATATAAAAAARGVALSADEEPEPAVSEPDGVDEDWAADVGCTAKPLLGFGLPVLDIVELGAVAGEGVTERQANLNGVAIQGAIDAVSAAGGGVVHVPEGVFETRARLYMRSGALLQGEGDGSVLTNVRGVECIVYEGTADSWIADTAIRDVHLRGIGEDSLNFAALIAMRDFTRNARIERVRFTDAGYDAWYALMNVEDVCVLDSTVYGTLDDGLNPGGKTEGAGTTRVFIARNVISGVAHDGIHVSQGSHHIVVVDNVVTDSANGIAFVDCSDVVVRGNRVLDCEEGIVTTHYATPRVVVDGNRVERVAGDAIRVTGDDAVVSGNVVSDANVGVRLDSLRGRVTANEIKSCGGGGVVIEGAEESSGVRVTGNSIRSVSAGAGVSVDAACSAVVDNDIAQTDGPSILDLFGHSRVVGNATSGAVINVPGDTNCDGSVSFLDLAAIAPGAGECAVTAEECWQDVDGDGVVGAADLGLVMDNLGN